MGDSRVLPVSMPLTFPFPATFTTERGRLRLSPTSDTDSDTPESDTLELDSRALPVSMLPMSPCLVHLDFTFTERGKPRLSLSTDTDTVVSDMLARIRIRNPLQPCRSVHQLSGSCCALLRSSETFRIFWGCGDFIEKTRKYQYHSVMKIIQRIS